MMMASTLIESNGVAGVNVKNRIAGAAVRTITRPSNVEIDQRLERLSRWMDSQFRIPVIGWRFGLNPIIDLIPGFGDIATSLVAIYVMASGIRYRVSRITLLRMAINIAIYFIVGLIPWLGDLSGPGGSRTSEISSCFANAQLFQGTRRHRAERVIGCS